MEEKKLVPEIRFKGYDDEWESKEFSKSFDFLKNNTLSRAYLSTSKVSDIRNIHYGDILIKFGEIIYGSKDEIPYINHAVDVETNNQSLLSNGDIIFADTAEDETVGKCSEIRDIDEYKIISGLHTIPVRPLNSYSEGYLGYFFNSPAYHDSLLPLIQGTKVLSLSKYSISSTPVSYPKIDEQKEIGDYFKKLDGLIADTEKEIKRLEKLKTASLQKMFPQPGESVPQIRFNGFTETWEEIKLEDRVTFSRGSGYSKSDLKEQGHQIFLYGRLYTDYSTYIEEVDTYSHLIPHAILSKGSEVVLPSSGETAEDIAVASAILKPNIILGGGLNILYPDSQIDSIFLALLLTYGPAHDDLSKKAQGKSVVHIYNQDIAELYILIPSIEEQKAIGEYFRNLDNIIKEKKKKVSQLRNLKKASLSKMFVNTAKQ